MASRSFIIMVLISFTLMVYLAVSAPPPLLEGNPIERTLPIQTVFSIVEAENDVVRELWTSEIVGAGKLVGLQFKEGWRERGVEAGPLPALFLRETAKNLETMPVRLSLGLGSDFPIKSINRFEGKLKEKFQKIKATGEPQFFFDEDTGLYFAIFPDIAVVHSCVQCHNEHEQSSKHDWKLNDVMGATSWSYPSGHVSWEEAIEIVTALRKSVRQAYTAYLAKTASFAKKPAIGEKWPREGLYLPSAEVFMRRIAELTSAQTLEAFLSVAETFSEIQVVYAQEPVGN